MASSQHFDLWYWPGSIDASLLTDLDDNGVPDSVESTLATLEDAWAFYGTGLGMTAPGGKVSFHWADPYFPLVDGRAASLPTRDIYVPEDYATQGSTYLPVHELFHQFQWTYLGSALGNLNAWENTKNINWWMESTAEWGTKEYALAELSGTTQSAVVSRAGQDIASFFATPGEHLSFGNLTIPTSRQYGAVAAVEFFTQQLGQDFVRNSWESVTGEYYLDGVSQLQATLFAHYYGDVADWMPYMWDSLYNMCDPASYEMGGVAVADWCAITPPLVTFPPAASVVRPLHSASPNRGGATTNELRGGGAFFHDLGLSPTAVGQRLSVTVKATRTASLSVVVTGWAASPAGTCDQAWGSADGLTDDPSAGLTVVTVLPEGCSNATIKVVDKDLANPAHDIELSWNVLDEGAVIGNGTVTLGVMFDGSLGLGGVRDWVCRTARAGADQPDSDELSVGPGLRDEATGFDAIKDAWGAGCSRDLGEGWSIVDPNDPVTTWSKPALGGGQTYDGEVESFTHTQTDATSIVPLGDKYKLIHHWHPSSIDPRVYQLDVTIEPTGTYGALPLRYRRVVGLEIDGGTFGDIGDYVSLTRGNGDGVADATRTLFWNPNSEDFPGMIDDPLVALPHYAFDDLPTNWTARDELGVALDVPIGSSTRTTLNEPEFSLFYGFADTPAQATTVLNGLGATTRAVSQQEAEDATHTVLIGFRDTP